MRSSAPTLLTRVYYRAKPFIPRKLRWILRRSFAQKVLRSSAEVWPIYKKAGTPPPDWTGWPECKSFAFVLTHDIESQLGVDNVRRLAKLEMDLGFRSSFNFIPEGTYQVPAELRTWLVEHGFEVGVHDLNHDGHLYESRSEFHRKAARINRFLAEWDAVGFRSGFMLRQLDWLHDLNLLYDSSTFDTDPFEPQPDGAGTIFPFRVLTNRTGKQSSYIELPYTLPQDSTLFLLLEEKTPETWIKKLNWIAQRRGMALVNVHPDYMFMEGQVAGEHQYPATLYREFLETAKRDHQDAWWHGLPREIAAHASRTLPAGSGRVSSTEGEDFTSKPTIWIDLDNTPHVPFFVPIIRELKSRGFAILLTVRDAFQVCEVADQNGLAYQSVGRHNGRNLLRKSAGLLQRAFQLAPIARSEKPALAVSHGSRAQLLAGRFLGIPTLEFTDYEHAQSGGLLAPTWLMGPAALGDTDLARQNGSFRSYPGYKEDVYATNGSGDTAILKDLSLSPSDIVATVRPPATEAHYHDGQSEDLLQAFMNRILATDYARVVLLPRNRKQEADLRGAHPQWFADGKTVVPETALDGMHLIAHSDLVVSGGGTMAREAAALGVPAYSIFSGKLGAVDRQLASEGRLHLIKTKAEVDSNIPLVKRQKPARAVTSTTASNSTLECIVDTIAELAHAAARR